MLSLCASCALALARLPLSGCARRSGGEASSCSGAGGVLLCLALSLFYSAALLSLSGVVEGAGCWSLPGVATSTSVFTIFSIGCLGWDDDEGCSKV